jgi:hypothetical protein
MPVRILDLLDSALVFEASVAGLFFYIFEFLRIRSFVNEALPISAVEYVNWFWRSKSLSCA